MTYVNLICEKRGNRGNCINFSGGVKVETAKKFRAEFLKVKNKGQNSPEFGRFVRFLRKNGYEITAMASTKKGVEFVQIRKIKKRKTIRPIPRRTPSPIAGQNAIRPPIYTYGKIHTKPLSNAEKGKIEKMLKDGKKEITPRGIDIRNITAAKDKTVKGPNHNKEFLRRFIRDQENKRGQRRRSLVR
ncbi:MAG: hypothetical protein HQ564_06195 [Candidatus Saganbacteria bacterium]|nr:hypothetical protein [Candidatus Saganbacteria bacterium]